jgi:hypothetical protein
MPRNGGPLNRVPATTMPSPDTATPSGAPAHTECSPISAGELSDALLINGDDFQALLDGGLPSTTPLRQADFATAFVTAADASTPVRDEARPPFVLTRPMRAAHIHASKF